MTQRSSRVAGALALAMAGVLATAHPAQGQSAGYYVTPSFSVGEEYRSNIFETSKSPQGDFVTRITPGLVLGFRSEPFTVLASYQLTSEIYARNADLDTPVARQAGSLALRYSPDRRLTLRLDGAYSDTNDASQFLLPFTPALATSPPGTAGTTAPGTGGATTTPTTAPGSGGAGATVPPPGTPGGSAVVPAVSPGRRHGSALSVAAGASYALDARTSLDGGYTYTRTRLAGSPDDQSHQGSLGVSRQLTPEDQGSLIYRLTVFESTSATPGLTTNSALVGWSRRLTERLSASLEAGPRFDSDGGVGAEANATVSYALSQGSAGLVYHHGQGLALGRSGASLVDAGTASLIYQPLRELTLSLLAGVTRTETLGSSGSSAAPPPGSAGPPLPGSSGTSGTPGSVETVYSAGISGAYQLTASLTWRVYYQFSHDVRSGQSDIDDHVAGMSLDWSYPFRIE